MKPVILKTKRLVLRPVNRQDYRSLIEGLADLQVSGCVVSMPHPYTLEMAKEYYQKQAELWEEERPSEIPFIIEYKPDNRAIGSIGLHKIDYDKKTAETGSWLIPAYWRQGIMTEAKIAINDFVFNSLGFKEISSLVFTNNIASNATQLKMGYEKVGFKRDACASLATDIVHDENIYLLTKEAWQKSRKRLT